MLGDKKSAIRKNIAIKKVPVPFSVPNHFTVRKLNANLIVLDEHAAIMMPIYLELLESDETPRNTKACILAEVRRQNQIDRSSFILVCHDLLRSKNIRGAMQLLAQIGTEYDTAPLHILLMDEADIIRIEACETIGKIGGKKDVIAIDLWLRSGQWHDDKYHKERVQKMRDELAAKLKKEDDYRNSRPDPSFLKAKPFK